MSENNNETKADSSSKTHENSGENTVPKTSKKASEEFPKEATKSQTIPNSEPAQAQNTTTAQVSNKTSGSRLALINFVLLIILLAGLGWWLFGQGWWAFVSGPPDTIDSTSIQEKVEQQTLIQQQTQEKYRAELGAEIKHLQSELNTLQQSLDTRLNNANSQVQEKTETIVKQSLNTQVTKLKEDVFEQVASQQDQFLQQQRGQQERQKNDIEQRLLQLENTADQGLSRIRSAQEQTLLQQRLAEAADLLRYAERQLVLGNNKKVAADAYQLVGRLLQTGTAGERLENLPGITTLRQTLARESAAINAVEVPAIDTAVNHLMALSEAVGQWTINNTETPEPANSTNDTNAPTTTDTPSTWQKLRNTLGKVVKVRRDDSVRLPLQEQALIRQQVQMQLQSLGLLALQQRQTAFATQLENTNGYIQEWFDTETAPVKAVLQQLESFQNMQLQPQWPTLGASLQQLQSLRDQTANNQSSLP